MCFPLEALEPYGPLFCKWLTVVFCWVHEASELGAYYGPSEASWQPSSGQPDFPQPLQPWRLQVLEGLGADRESLAEEGLEQSEGRPKNAAPKHTQMAQNGPTGHNKGAGCLCLCSCAFVCSCVCVFVCLCVYIYIYIYVCEPFFVLCVCVCVCLCLSFCVRPRAPPRARVGVCVCICVLFISFLMVPFYGELLSALDPPTNRTPTSTKQVIPT